MTDEAFMWASHWTPPPPDSTSTNDLIARAMGQTFRPERMSDRQRAAVLDYPRRVGLGGERRALLTQQGMSEAEYRRELIASMDKARKGIATSREAI